MADLYGYTENKERDAVINDNSLSELQNTIRDLTNTINDYWKKIYPVGSIYFSTTQTNPGSIFGGTWVAWGSGRVPVGVDITQTEFNTVNKTGGAKTHTLTIAEMPAHTHQYRHYFGKINADDGPYGSLPTGVTDPGGPTKSTGGGQAHNNLQPYITCYMWRRTA